MMKPFEFTVLKKAVNRLVEGYAANLDPVVLDVLKGDALVVAKQYLTADEPATTNFLFEVSNRHLTPELASQALATLNSQVEGFPQLDSETLDHLFKHQKRVVEPDWHTFDLKAQTYLGWNDIATQSKYMVAYHHHQLVGVNGVLMPGSHQGICAICKNMSRVSLFTATTVKNNLGNYQTNGNYICRDSRLCNQQLTSDEALNEFMETVLPR